MLTPVALELGQILYEPRQRLEHIYLPTAGIISLVVVMPDGQCAETAAIGCEGAAGLNASGFVDTAFTRFQVQLPGTPRGSALPHWRTWSTPAWGFAPRYRDIAMF